LLVLVLGALLVPAAASGKVRFFVSPTGNISCEVAAKDPRGTYAYCQTFRPVESVKMNAKGHSKVCKGWKCVGDPPGDAFTLGYGDSVRVGPFRCTSRTTGMTCRAIGKGHGFVISRAGIDLF
jgi:hypothetical protein